MDKREFEKILYEVLKNKVEDINKNEVDETNREKDFNLIDIDSPLFEIILKSNNLEKYTIYISFEDNETDEKEKETNEKKIIEKERKTKQEYSRIFNKLNKSNINYSSVRYNLDDVKKLKYLKELNIDFNKIKRISLAILKK